LGAESDSGNQYHKLFNSKLTGDRLWKSVQVLRAIDAALEAERAKRWGREKQIGVHGNRLISHLVFRALPDGTLSDPNTDMNQLLGSVPALVGEKYQRVAELIEADYPTNYLASLFKNGGRCREVVSKVSSAPPPSA